jgi:hypothetical protein
MTCKKLQASLRPFPTNDSYIAPWTVSSFSLGDLGIILLFKSDQPPAVFAANLTVRSLGTSLSEIDFFF